MATYYVATDGNDTNTGGSADEWLTIQHAVEQVAAGDTIIVRDGTYSDNVYIAYVADGTSGNEITLQAENRYGAIIDGNYTEPTGGTQAYAPGSYAKSGCSGGTGTALDNIYEALIYLSVEYWIVDGFVVKQSRGSGISMNDDPKTPDNIVVKNCKMQDNRMYGFLAEDSTNITLQNCEVSGSGNFAPFSRGSGVLDWPTATFIARCDTVTVNDCNIFNNWGEGITTTGDNIDVYDNKVYNNYALQIYIAHCTNTNVYRNIVWQASNDDTYWRNCEPSAGIVINMETQFDGDPGYPENNNIAIYNNLVVGCNGNINLWDNQATSTLLTQNLDIYNNTFIDAYEEPLKLVGDDLDTYYQTCTFKNNLFSQANGETTFGDNNTFASTDIDFDYNLWPATPGNSNCSGANDVVDADAELVNPISEITLGQEPLPENYKLESTSPAADAALNSAAPSADYFGTTRPVNTTSDIGWHEYTSSGAGSTLTAGITATPTNGTAPFQVNFSDNSTGSPETFHWDFGTGVTSTLEDPGGLIYTIAGEYTVTHTVTKGSFGPELIRNGDFETPQHNDWYSYDSGGSPFVASNFNFYYEISATNHQAQVEVEAVGGSGNPVGGSIYFYQKDIGIESGKTYRLSFFEFTIRDNSSTSLLRPVRITIENKAGTVNYGLDKTVNFIDAQPTTHVFHFTASGFTGGTYDTQLKFELAADAVHGDEFRFDNISLKELATDSDTATQIISVYPKGAIGYRANINKHMWAGDKMKIDNGSTPTITVLMADSGGVAKTGLTPTVQISKNGGAFANVTNSVTEIAQGWYKVTLTATETNTDGELIVRATGTGANEWREKYQVEAEWLTDAEKTAVADIILRRSLASAESSSDGDTLAYRSLIGAIAKLTNRVALSGSTQTVYKTDDSTALGSQTVTFDGNNNATEVDTN